MSNAAISIEHLESKIGEGFSNLVPPDEQNIVEHDCPECRAVRRVFRNEDWRKLSTRKIEWAYDKLPLFTPSAFQYFLPVFLLYSLRDPLSDVCQYTVYALAQQKKDDAWWQQKIENFTPEQKSICHLFLRWIYPNPEFSYDSRTIERALERW
jgi:hypothetical protein